MKNLDDAIWDSINEVMLLTNSSTGRELLDNIKRAFIVATDEEALQIAKAMVLLNLEKD